MNFTEITALLIDRGFSIEGFSNSSIEFRRVENGLVTIFDLEEEDINISVRDNETREYILDIDVKMNVLNKILLHLLILSLLNVAKVRQNVLLIREN